jgi:putative (di)nucleoside polyphosphate hydrolase
MSGPLANLPLPERDYRPNVGAALFNRDGLVLIARRAGLPRHAAFAWQMPQGGIDRGEAPERAVLRELAEEVGTNRAEIMGMHPGWLCYELPGPRRGRYKGQAQLWFALRFLGTDADIRLDADTHIEFDEWRWAELAELPDLVVPFKRAVYEVVAREFAPFAIQARNLAGG